MLKAALGFFILGILAIFFGLYGVAGLSIEIGKLLLFVFVAVAIIAFLAGLVNRRGTPGPMGR